MASFNDFFRRTEIQIEEKFYHHSLAPPPWRNRKNGCKNMMPLLCAATKNLPYFSFFLIWAKILCCLFTKKNRQTLILKAKLHENLYKDRQCFSIKVNKFFKVTNKAVNSTYTRYTFSSNHNDHNVHKNLCGLCFWPLIWRKSISSTK